VLDHLGAAAFLHTPEGRILYVNREWHVLFNPGGQPIEGRMLSELLPPEQVSEIRASTEAAIAQGRRAQHEITLPTSIGPRTFLVNKFVLTDPVGGVEAVCGIATDLTHVREREAHTRELEHRLAESRRLESLGVLAGGLAHDFNNLLQSMLGNASLLATELPEGSASRDYVAQIERAAHRAADLTRQMLDYAGLSMVTRDTIELAALLAEWEPLFREHVPGHVTLRVEPPDAGMPGVIGDAARLRLVLMSLATNAVEAAAQKPGRIVVRAKRRAPSPPPRLPQVHESLPRGDYVAIEVEDDGEGMDAHVVERLWDPFFSTRFPGRGLGLPAALGIARAHGGTIEVESTPGAGSVFRLVLPAAQPSRSATRNSAP
ncbi:MAG: ATP-binding protein, partial [Candidatus Eisenbacteria bacterium]